MNTWRLLIGAPAPGAWNMAVDEAVLEFVGRGESPPTLRMYAWEPPCLSLGYAQPLADCDQFRLRERGWEIVRRPTGGSAILHTDELTYAVMAPHDEPRVAGSVLESYFRLAQALALALEDLGLTVDIKERTKPSPAAPNPVCFEVSSAYEITVHGKKLIGSAQARRRQGVLQHGSLPLGGDLSRIVQVLAFHGKRDRASVARRLLEQASTLEVELGRPVVWEEAAHAFIRAFHTTFNITFETTTLTDNEKARSDELVRRKYAHSMWLSRV